MTPRSRYLALAFAAAATLACNPGGGPEPLELGQSHQAGDEVRLPGTTVQGRRMQARNEDRQPTITEPSTVSFDLTTLTLPGSPTALQRARVEQGDLVADRLLWPYPPGTSVTSLTSCHGFEPSNPSRNCGWKVDQVGRCTPGMGVPIGAGACGLGTCAPSPGGRMMMRICPGRAPCDYATSLASSVEQCGTSCPALTLNCPAGGLYTVMVASREPLGTGDADAAASAGDLPAWETLRGAALNNATVDGRTTSGATVRQQIVSVRPEDELPPFNVQPGGTAPNYELGTTNLYTLREQQPDGRYTLPDGSSAWFCSPNADGSPGEAIPVGYLFDDTGAMTYGGTGGPPGEVERPLPKISFACTGGTAAKCYRWGYRPWANAALPKYYWACTRMARADYCGSGQSYTQDETMVDPWDTLTKYWSLSPLQRHDALPDLQFEAGWSTGGAFCLSHQRWQDFSPDAECSLRLNEDQNTCNDEGEAQTWADDHHLTYQHLNDSRLNGAGGGT